MNAGPEVLLIHEAALRRFAEPGPESNLDLEKRHKTIIGRYPHRNASLGRRSTPEEIAFLREPGVAF